MTRSFPVLSEVRCKTWRFKQLVKKIPNEQVAVTSVLHFVSNMVARAQILQQKFLSCKGKYIKVYTFLMT